MPERGEDRSGGVRRQASTLMCAPRLCTSASTRPTKIWDTEGVGNDKKLVLTSNIDHPFYEVIEYGFLLWIKDNIVEAVAEFFTESTGRTEAMLLIKSDIPKHVGKMKMEIAEAPDADTEAAPQDAL